MMIPFLTTILQQIKSMKILLNSTKLLHIEITYHSEGHCTMDDINKIRGYLNNNSSNQKESSR